MEGRKGLAATFTCTNMHEEPAHKEQRSSSYGKHSGAFTNTTLAPGQQGAVCCRHIWNLPYCSPKKRSHDPVSSILFGPVDDNNAGVSRLCTRVKQRQEKTSKCPFKMHEKGGFLHGYSPSSSRRRNSAARGGLDPDAFLNHVFPPAGAVCRRPGRRLD